MIRKKGNILNANSPITADLLQYTKSQKKKVTCKEPVTACTLSVTCRYEAQATGLGLLGLETRHPRK